MSLDFCLEGNPVETTCSCMQCGNEHQRLQYAEAFSINITHNLGEMAEAAGIYKVLWRPEEIPVTKAKEIVTTLKAGLKKLKAAPKKFKKFDCPNGWGTYEHFVPFVEEVLAACIKYPEFNIRVNR